MKPEEARIGMYVSVNLTGQIVGIYPTKLEVRVQGMSNCVIPVESAEMLSHSETLGTD